MSQHLKTIIKLKCLIAQIFVIHCQSYSNYGYYDYSGYNYPPGTVEAAGLQCSLQQIYNTYYSGYSTTPAPSSAALACNDYQLRKCTDYAPSSGYESQYPSTMTQQIFIVNEDSNEDRDMPLGELLSMLIALKDDEDDDEPIMYPYPVPYPVPCCCECSDDCGKCRYAESEFSDFDFICEDRGHWPSGCEYCSKRRNDSANPHRGKSTCKCNRGSSYDTISHRLFKPDYDEDSCGCTSTKINYDYKKSSRKENMTSKKRSSNRSRDCDCESTRRKYEY